MTAFRRVTAALSFIALALPGLSSPTHATSNLIQNSDFSDVSGPVGSFNGYTVYDTAADWSVFGNVVFSGAESNGQSAAIFNGGDQLPLDFLSQSFKTKAGQSYTVSFDYGAYGASTPQVLNAVVSGTSPLLGLKTATANGNGTGGAAFSAYSFNFVADSDTSTITFDDLGSTTASVDGVLTNIDIRAVPEASTVVLFAIAIGAGLLVLRRRSPLTA